LFFGGINGEIPGKKIPPKMNFVNARIEACVYTKFTFFIRKEQKLYL
jgi:hypothetical protein